MKRQCCMLHTAWHASTLVGLVLNTLVAGRAQEVPAVAAPSSSPAVGPVDATRQSPPGGLLLKDFIPEPRLVVPQTQLEQARFPAIDVHVHPRIRLHSSPEGLDEYVRLMDAQNIAVSVSLDGGWGDELSAHTHYLWDKYPHRFMVFANLDWRGSGKEGAWETWDCNRPEFARQAAEKLRQAKQQGAVGLKIFKDFGLVYRDAQGKLLELDDPRWDPIWSVCGELGFPVLIHVADPAAFFDPVDATNERYEELSRHPEWSFHGPGFPRRAELLAAFLRVVERHPGTQFIGAHVGGNAEDLATVEQWLAKYPNLQVETAARIAELGRQPFTARKFLLNRQDRILFGTDGPRHPDRLKLHWRFFETQDEYFPYAENAFPPQGLWRIYGVNLPEDALRKIYAENAIRLLPGLAEKYRVACQELSERQRAKSE